MIVLLEKLSDFLLGHQAIQYSDRNSARNSEKVECNYLDDYYGDQVCVPVVVERD